MFLSIIGLNNTRIVLLFGRTVFQSFIMYSLGKEDNHMLNRAIATVTMDWDVGTFLRNATSTVKSWGGLVVILIGVVMVIAAVLKAAHGLMSHGKVQTNWAIVILLLILGGAFMVGGFTFVSNIASGGKKTLEELGGNAIYMRPFLR